MRPVVGSMCPSALAIWAVYQIVPSSDASGSCGREPGVGSAHSLNVTCAGPATIAPCGLAFSGKFSARYVTRVTNWSSDSCAPTFLIMWRTVLQSSIAGAKHAAELVASAAGALQDLL